MKRGFTLVELVVAISLSMVVFSLGVGYFSKINNRQELASLKSKLITDLKSSRNYAITMKKPDGYLSEVESVYLDFQPTGWAVIANGIGATYSYENIGSGFSISSDIGDIIFSRYDGKLMKNVSGSTVLADSATITITSTEVGDTQTVVIDSLGVAR